MKDLIPWHLKYHFGAGQNIGQINIEIYKYPNKDLCIQKVIATMCSGNGLQNVALFRMR